MEDLYLIGILRQTPMLEALTLSVYSAAVLDPLTMPSLRELNLKVDDHMKECSDHLLRGFTCPSLMKLSFTAHSSWTCETFEILKRQYNMQELREVNLMGYIELSVSSLLRDAPMLQSLSLTWGTIMDGEAVLGMSNGSLGRFLRKLDISIFDDLEEMLDVVETRKKVVDELKKNGCSWREEITVLKDVLIRTDDQAECEESLIALKEAGIAITIWRY